MPFLPIFMDVSRCRVLVIGGGTVAEQKLNYLLKFTKKISVLSRAFNDGVLSLGVECIRADYASQHLQGAGLVYACTNNRATNKKIKLDAEKLKIPVNVVDDPALCDFITPAVHASHNFCVAVSTFGKSPSGAVKIRNKIRDYLPAPDLDALVAELAARRKKTG
jgi:siroheme synthase-like protein